MWIKCPNCGDQHKVMPFVPFVLAAGEEFVVVCSRCGERYRFTILAVHLVKEESRAAGNYH